MVRIKEPLEFAVFKALSPKLQRRAEGFGCAQILSGIRGGLSRCREPPIFRVATLRGLEQKQFSRGAVVEGRHASTVQPPACGSWDPKSPALHNARGGHSQRPRAYSALLKAGDPFEILSFAEEEAPFWVRRIFLGIHA